MISFKRQPSTMDGSSRQPKKRHPKTYFSLEKRTICQDISSTSQKKYLEQLCQKKKDLVTNLSDLRVKLSYVVPERYVPPTYKSHWDFVLDEMVLLFSLKRWIETRVHGCLRRTKVEGSCCLSSRVRSSTVHVQKERKRTLFQRRSIFLFISSMP